MSRRNRLKEPSGKYKSWSPELESQLDSMISVGDCVKKISGRPFKSGLYLATVKNKAVEPSNKRIILEFEEDDSWVEIHRCVLWV